MPCFACACAFRVHIGDQPMEIRKNYLKMRQSIGGYVETCIGTASMHKCIAPNALCSYVRETQRHVKKLITYKWLIKGMITVPCITLGIVMVLYWWLYLHDTDDSVDVDQEPLSVTAESDIWAFAMTILEVEPQCFISSNPYHSFLNC